MATRLTSFDELAAYRLALGAKRDPNRTCVTVCGGTGCRACQGLDVAAAFRKAFQEHALEGKVDLRVTGCLGFCEHGPVVTLRPKGLIYVKVTAADAKEIVEKTVLDRKSQHAPHCRGRRSSTSLSRICTTCSSSISTGRSSGNSAIVFIDGDPSSRTSIVLRHDSH